mgnify:CR=1 FL=1
MDGHNRALASTSDRTDEVVCLDVAMLVSSAIDSSKDGQEANVQADHLAHTQFLDERLVENTEHRNDVDVLRLKRVSSAMPVTWRITGNEG